MEKKKTSSTNDVGITDCQHAKNGDRSISMPMYKIQVQTDQRPQHKSSQTEPVKEKVGSSFECMGTENHFLNIHQ